MSGCELDFDLWYRRPVVMRMDALCYGALAYVGMARFAARLKPARELLAIVGLAGIGLVLAWHPEPNAVDQFTHVWFWSVAPVSATLLVPLFFWRGIEHKAIASVARFISTRTYAIYLVHPLAALALSSLLTPITGWTLLPFLVLVSADAIYRTVERPLLRLRPISAQQVTTPLSSHPCGIVHA